MRQHVLSDTYETARPGARRTPNTYLSARDGCGAEAVKVFFTSSQTCVAGFMERKSPAERAKKNRCGGSARFSSLVHGAKRSDRRSVAGFGA